MIKCQKQDGHVQGFSVLRIFSHIPQLANGHCFGGSYLCRVCFWQNLIELIEHILGGGNSFFVFHPKPWGRWTHLTNIFLMGCWTTTKQHLFTTQMIAMGLLANPFLYFSGREPSWRVFVCVFFWRMYPIGSSGTIVYFPTFTLNLHKTNVGRYTKCFVPMGMPIVGLLR